ncbi:MAG: hypothetical protein Q4F82_08140, partial [bacterium]|nr:hypothetical protein [bacterium]
GWGLVLKLTVVGLSHCGSRPFERGLKSPVSVLAALSGLSSSSLCASPFAKGGRGDSTTRFAPRINKDSTTRFAPNIHKDSKAPLRAIQCCLFPAEVCF